MILIFAFIILLALACPKEKWVAALALAFMFLMYSFVYYEGDLQIYEWIYREYGASLDTTTFEPLFTALIIVCKALGFSFTGFRMILALIFCTLLYTGISRYTEYVAISTALIGVFPFFIFTSVMRSGIAFVILLNGFHYLIKPSNSRRDSIKYIIIVAIASLVHYSSVLMLVFLLVRKGINKNKKIVYALASFCFFIVLNYTNILLTLAQKVTNREKSLQWFARNDGTANIKGAIAIVIILSLNIFISICVRKYFRHKPRLDTQNDRQNLLSESCVDIAFVLACLFPLMIFASPFMRIAYIVFPILVANGVNASYGIKSHRYARLSTSFIGLVNIFSVVVIRLYSDLPYIKDGYIPLQELISTKFVFY